MGILMNLTSHMLGLKISQSTGHQAVATNIQGIIPISIHCNHKIAETTSKYAFLLLYTISQNL